MTAAERVYKYAIRTPLIRLPLAHRDIYLKLENLQPVGSFKIRGAANAIGQLSAEQLEKGVVTASMGNMAQGVAWCARERGVRCTVIVPEVAAQNKIDAIERLGGHVLRVTFDQWWKAFQDRGYPGLEGEFIHAFDDPRVMEGNGTIAHEILDALPDPDAVLIPWGGGGLACGIASVLRERRPICRIYGCEVATAAPLSASLEMGGPAIVDYQPSFVDGIGSKTVFPSMLERAKRLLDGALVAPLERVEAAVRFLAERARTVAEGAGACSLAAAYDARVDGRKVVCIVSGGNINSPVLSRILASAGELEWT